MKLAVKITLVILGIVATLLLAAIAFYFGVTRGVRLDADKLTLDKTCIREYAPFKRKNADQKIKRIQTDAHA